jgi:hypothetical protein
MAKRKAKKAITRRRSVSGVQSGLLPTFGGVAAGAVAARIVSSKFLSSFDPKIASAVTLAAGIFLSMQKSPIFKGIGLGMFGAGVISAGQSFNLLSGVPNRSSWLQDAGINEMPTIAGTQARSLNFLGNPFGTETMPVINGVGNPQGDPSMSVIS